jgi:hypothetical protein
MGALTSRSAICCGYTASLGVSTPTKFTPYVSTPLVASRWARSQIGYAEQQNLLTGERWRGALLRWSSSKVVDLIP